MKFIKVKPKTELEQVKEECKAQDFDYDKTPLSADYDTMGNILSIQTNEDQDGLSAKQIADCIKLQNILKSKGFIE